MLHGAITQLFKLALLIPMVAAGGCGATRGAALLPPQQTAERVVMAATREVECPVNFARVKSLGEAVEVVHRTLRDDGKGEYVALVSEPRMRDAIRTAVVSYERLLDGLEVRMPGVREQFEREVKPVCLRVADSAEWPQGCWFESFYTLSEGGVTYDGLGLRLFVSTPNARFVGFAVPVVDLFYGRFFARGTDISLDLASIGPRPNSAVAAFVSTSE